MRAGVIIVGVVAALASRAEAQPNLPAAPLPGEVNPDDARTLSVGGAGGSWALIAAGLAMKSAPIGLVGLFSSVITPSFGHWYAGSVGGTGLAMRVVGVGAMVLAIGKSYCEDEGCGDDDMLGLALIAGFTLHVTGTIYDFTSAPAAARSFNQRLRKLSVSPLVGYGRAGLAIGGRF